MLNMLPKFELDSHQDVLGDVLDRAAPFDHAVMHDAEIALEQHEIGCLLGHVGGAVDRDADVRRMQRRSVVDAVAEKAHNFARALQGQENALLLLRR